MLAMKRVLLHGDGWSQCGILRCKLRVAEDSCRQLLNGEPRIPTANIPIPPRAFKVSAPPSRQLAGAGNRKKWLAIFFRLRHNLSYQCQKRLNV